MLVRLFQAAAITLLLSIVAGMKSPTAPVPERSVSQPVTPTVELSLR